MEITMALENVCWRIATFGEWELVGWIGIEETLWVEVPEFLGFILWCEGAC